MRKNNTYKYIWVLVCLSLFYGLNSPGAGEKIPAQMVGQLDNKELVECSGIETSLATDSLFWAINDGGGGPFLYALGRDGRDRGRVLVKGARNRDWEGVDTFFWHGCPMILIADIGDNDEKHKTHTIYIVKDPGLKYERFDQSAFVEVAWRIEFSYPDHNHDAEAVAVDMASGKILVLTKRDHPPLLFELPLTPVAADQPVVAHSVGEVDKIPPPSVGDLFQKHGISRSRPTAMDISGDGLHAVVLTYKHAYLFNRNGQDSWEKAFGEHPILIPLPLPEDCEKLRQREAICFGADNKSLFVTSEGKGAAIFRLEIK
jgi:hypothetical protein